jgi:hypothetical protein
LFPTPAGFGSPLSRVCTSSRQDLLAIYFHAGAVPQRSLTNRFVIPSSMTEDVIWAGTLGGIFKYDLRTRQFSMQREIVNGGGDFRPGCVPRCRR